MYCLNVYFASIPLRFLELDCEKFSWSDSGRFTIVFGRKAPLLTNFLRWEIAVNSILPFPLIAIICHLTGPHSSESCR